MNHYFLSMRLVFFLFIICFSSPLFSQEDDLDKGFDIGINVTSVVSSFSGNGSFLEASDFPISLRWRKKNKVLRMGFGLVGKSSEFFDNITSSFRESSEQEIYSRIGFEILKPINNKWSIYWGADVIGQYKNESVVISNQFSSKISNRTIGVGGGFLLGIKFNLTERLYLSSESTLYFIQRFLRRQETGNTFFVLNTESQDFSLQPPLFLYLNYAF